MNRCPQQTDLPYSSCIGNSGLEYNTQLKMNLTPYNFGHIVGYVLRTFTGNDYFWRKLIGSNRQVSEHFNSRTWMDMSLFLFSRMILGSMQIHRFEWTILDGPNAPSFGVIPRRPRGHVEPMSWVYWRLVFFGPIKFPQPMAKLPGVVPRSPE